MGAWVAGDGGGCQGKSLAPKQDVMEEKQKCSHTSFPMGEESPTAHGDAQREKSQLTHLLGSEATEPSHKAGPFLSSRLSSIPFSEQERSEMPLNTRVDLEGGKK